MGADYLFELRNIEIWAPAFFKHSISSVATVFNFCFLLWTLFCWGPFTNFPFFYSEKKIRKFLIQEVLKLWARRMWLALEVIIDKSGGERFLWSRNWDFDWFLAPWQKWKKNEPVMSSFGGFFYIFVSKKKFAFFKNSVAFTVFFFLRKD